MRLFVLALALVSCTRSPEPQPATSDMSSARTDSKAAPSDTRPHEGLPVPSSAAPVRMNALFQGTCAPAGSRGGCYRLTLKADGTFQHVLMDATMGGTYVIDGGTLTLTFPKGGPEPQTLTSTDNWNTLSNGYKRLP